MGWSALLFTLTTSSRWKPDGSTKFYYKSWRSCAQMIVFGSLFPVRLIIGGGIAAGCVLRGTASPGRLSARAHRTRDLPMQRTSTEDWFTNWDDQSGRTPPI